MNLLLTLNDLPVKIPESDWLRFGILLLVFLAALQTVRLISRFNRYLLLFVVVVGTTGLLASWVHNRNEPSFLTPVVDIVEPWFPKRVRNYTASWIEDVQRRSIPGDRVAVVPPVLRQA